MKAENWMPSKMKKYNWEALDGMKGQVKANDRPEAIKTIVGYSPYKYREIKSVRLAN